MMKTKELALCGMLTALALGLSYVEAAFPMLFVVPLPGVKLGLANLVTVFALYALGSRSALGILVARCVLGGVFAGNLNALLYSLLGGLCAMMVMMVLSRWKGLSLYGVSMGGAAGHNCGQILAAVVALGNTAPVYYLPFLLVISLVTGGITGLLASLLFQALDKANVNLID